MLRVLPLIARLRLTVEPSPDGTLSTCGKEGANTGDRRRILLGIPTDTDSALMPDRDRPAGEPGSLLQRPLGLSTVNEARRLQADGAKDRQDAGRGNDPAVIHAP